MGVDDILYAVYLKNYAEFSSVDVFGLSTFRSVDVSVCRRFGLSTFWFVDVSVCPRLGLSTFWLSTFRFVDVLTSNRAVYNLRPLCLAWKTPLFERHDREAQKVAYQGGRKNAKPSPSLLKGCHGPNGGTVVITVAVQFTLLEVQRWHRGSTGKKGHPDWETELRSKTH